MKDGNYHTNVLESLDGDDAIETFQEAVFNWLREDEVIFTYDDSTVDLSAGFIFYKYNGNLINEYIIKDKESFEIDVEMINWVYPETKRMTKTESSAFVQRLNDYILEYQVPIKITGEKKLPVSRPKMNDEPELSKSQINLILLYSVLAEYGFLLVISIILYVYLNYNNNLPETVFFISLSVFINGVYYAMRIKHKFKHIYRVFQDKRSKFTNPDDNDWDSLSKVYKLGIPILFLTAGIIGMMYVLIVYYL